MKPLTEPGKERLCPICHPPGGKDSLAVKLRAAEIARQKEEEQERNRQAWVGLKNARISNR